MYPFNRFFNFIADDLPRLELDPKALCTCPTEMFEDGCPFYGGDKSPGCPPTGRPIFSLMRPPYSVHMAIILQPTWKEESFIDRIRLDCAISCQIDGEALLEFYKWQSETDEVRDYRTIHPVAAGVDTVKLRKRVGFTTIPRLKGQNGLFSERLLVCIGGYRSFFPREALLVGPNFSPDEQRVENDGSG